jgi:ribosomal 50S subunit-recycling heat shock protein
MRLDLFLKASRLVLRRSLAQKFCDAGQIKLNGSKAKPGKELKPGDVLDIKRGNKILTIKVTQIPGSKQVSRSSAADLYEVVSEEITEDTSSLDLLFEMEDSSSKPAP